MNVPARPTSAAVLNWLWLASTERRERVLLISESMDGWTDALRRHFREVEHRDCSALNSRLPFEDASLDCVLLPGVVGCWDRVSAPGSPRARRAAVIGECRRVLRAGGVLLLSGMNPQWYGGEQERIPHPPCAELPHARPAGLLRRLTPSVADLTLGGALERAGFQPVHEYFADPSDLMPRAIIPACRSAAIAYERQERALRGRAPRLLAAVGLHSMIYPARMVLAFA